MNITGIIEEIREVFMLEHNLNNFQEINCGYCDLFAQEVLWKLNDLNFYEMDTHEIVTLEDEETDYGIIDENEVRMRFNIDIPPNLTNVQIGYHVWITDNKRHYDAECPLGVTNMFELPFFKRYYSQIKKR
ncbi:hypothetical protein ACFVS2_26730 [Brevibacillus sp. NPDC058079]|uniref:hypothetical protein n=1 Tax=Brevibacillus sp. NPDC058079 TaxID=3346330 RepID=UPI0036EB111B